MSLNNPLTSAEISRLEDALLRFTPGRSWEVKTVSFPPTADTDLDIAHTLPASDPSRVDYQVLQVSSPCLVYHDTSPDRVAWSNGIIRLRCTQPSASVVLVLSTSGDINDRTDPLHPAGTPKSFLINDSTYGPVSIGILPASSGRRQLNGIDMSALAAGSSTSRWRIGAYNSASNQRELVFIDMLEAGNPYTFHFKRTASNEYTFEPESAVDLILGEDTSTGRLTAVNSSIVRAGTLYVGSTLPSGRWNAVAYNSGNFTGSGSMTWTVESGDVVDYSYMRHDKTAILSLWLDNTAVGGTPDVSLAVALPFTAATAKVTTCELYDNGALVDGAMWVGASGTQLAIARRDRANFTAGAVSVHGQIALEIA